MPKIVAVSAADAPHKLKQTTAKEFAREFFAVSFPDVERILPAFDNTLIEERNFVMPYEWYHEHHTFEQKNKLYVDVSLKLCEGLISECLDETGFSKDDVTDLIFVSTTGIATPSLDALLVNKMRLNPNVNRTPVWGLGCAGGVAGVAKANTAAKANPNAVVLLVAVELCSLTFIGKDFSKSNFIATSLFSDGAACCMIVGDAVAKRLGGNSNSMPAIEASQSKLYYDTLDVMGWDVKDDGLKVIFSRDIPTIIKDIIKPDIESFLAKHNLSVNDVRNWVAHPGGAKVIAAYTEALKIDDGCFENTKAVLRRYGNMSSVTVLYVLKEFFEKGFDDGYGVMMALGPGFSSELVLIKSVG